MASHIRIPRTLATHLLRHLTDIMTTDEAHLIFDTDHAHTEVIEHTAELFAHIINQTP